MKKMLVLSLLLLAGCDGHHYALNIPTKPACSPSPSPHPNPTPAPLPSPCPHGHR